MQLVKRLFYLVIPLRNLFYRDEKFFYAINIYLGHKGNTIISFHHTKSIANVLSSDFLLNTATEQGGLFVACRTHIFSFRKGKDDSVCFDRVDGVGVDTVGYGMRLV